MQVLERAAERSAASARVGPHSPSAEGLVQLRVAQVEVRLARILLESESECVQSVLDLTA